MYINAAANSVVLIFLMHVPCIWHAVTQLVEALLYKSEGRGFDSDGVTGISH